MDKVKKYIIYVVLIIIFAVISDFLITVGINSTYNSIDCASDIPAEVVIYQAEATTVNGRIRGMIKNDESNNIKGNYLKFDFFSKRDVNMGSKYIEIDKTKTEIPFEAFFKLNNVSYYKVSFVDQKEPQGEIEFIHKDFSKKDIFLMALAAIFVVPLP